MPIKNINAVGVIFRLHTEARQLNERSGDSTGGIVFEDQGFCQQSTRGFPYTQAVVSPAETPCVVGSALCPSLRESLEEPRGYSPRSWDLGIAGVLEN
jgi:hypothetical protein